MSSLRKSGEYVQKTAKDTGYNVRRVTEKFPTPERNVQSFSAANSYQTTFTAGSQVSQVRLNLKVEEHPDLCTISAATLRVNCSARHVLDATTGHFASFYSNSGGFTINALGQVVFPVDGCYDISWTSSVGGIVSGDQTQVINVTLIHNSTIIRSATNPATGYISILGPNIYTYACPSPLYARVGAAAGDVFQAAITPLNTQAGDPWFGIILGGFWTGESTANIQLVGTADV